MQCDWVKRGRGVIRTGAFYSQCVDTQQFQIEQLSTSNVQVGSFQIKEVREEDEKDVLVIQQNDTEVAAFVVEDDKPCN